MLANTTMLLAVFSTQSGCNELAGMPGRAQATCVAGGASDALTPLVAAQAQPRLAAGACASTHARTDYQLYQHIDLDQVRNRKQRQ